MRLVNDSGVTAVHICSPNYLHHDQCKAALEAGKHVLCEKPLAMNASESGTLVELARKSKRVGAVAYNLRYYPLCHQARALVQQGAIGEPRLIHGSFLQDWLLYPTDWNWRLQPELGGEMRVVADIGTHWLDLLTWITGRENHRALRRPGDHRFRCENVPAAEWKLSSKARAHPTTSKSRPMTTPPSF